MVNSLNVHRCLVSLIALSTLGLSHLAQAEDVCSTLLTQPISPDWVQAMIDNEENKSKDLVKLQEAARKKGVLATFKNEDVLKNHNNTYTKEIPSGVITDQQGSGRCWIFAGGNVFRIQLFSKGALPADFEFSQTYLWFFHLLEQSNEHFERVLLDRGLSYLSSDSRDALSTEIAQGGWFQVFSHLVDKYGLVSKVSMPETVATANPEMLMKDLNHQVAVTTKQIELAAKAGATTEELRKIKDKGNQDVFNVLTAFLGVPPTEFKMRTEDLAKARLTPEQAKGKYVTFSPKEFSKGYVGFNAEDWITVSAYPGQKQKQFYQIKKNPGDKTGYVPLSFLNLNVKRMKELTIESIDSGVPVWFAADVRQAVDSRTGIMHPDVAEHSALFGKKPKETQHELTRKEDNYFHLREAVHAMTFTGYDWPAGAKDVIKFKNENSWGYDAGHDGIYAAYLEWFNQYVFEVIVPKSLLKPEEKKLLAAPPVILNSEDEFNAPK